MNLYYHELKIIEKLLKQKLKSNKFITLDERILLSKIQKAIEVNNNERTKQEHNSL